MSFLEHSSSVRYACTCGKLKPISRIYFCRHCSKIRCGFCMCHEVDARYCPICMENLPVAEAWMKKNCCSACFTCPVCHHSLTTRITTVQSKKDKTEVGDKDEMKAEKSEKPEPPKKYYYLSCFFCHWTTRDANIPDQTTASGNWPELENCHSARINALIEYWKAVSLADRVIKEKKQTSTRRSYTHLSGMTAALARRKAGLPSYSPGPFGLSGLQEIRKPPQIEAPEPLSDIQDLPEDIFTSEPDLSKVTTLDQRLGIPDLQCLNTSNLQLCRRLLLTKRSQRCRECEHNVTKPEYNPSSIKFKIQLSAYYHIPEVHIKTCEPLRIGKDSNLIIKVVNPTPYQTTIRLLPIKEDDEIVSNTGASSLGAGDSETTEASALVSKKTPFTKIEPKPMDVEFTGYADLPDALVILPGRDDAAEYDDNSENQNFNDDPKIVVWRKGNKAAIQFPVRPREDLDLGTDVIIGFSMHHTYTNTIIQQKDQQKINHQVKLILTAGKLVGPK